MSANASTWAYALNDGVLDLAISADGTTVASAGNDDVVRLWRTVR